MNRTARDKNEFRPRPVQRLELDEHVSRKKLWIFAIAFAVAIAAFWYGFTQLTKQSSGWREIEAKRVSDGISCSADFVFYYDLGRGDLSATEEYKRIADLYTDCALHAYKAFSANEAFEGINNLWYLNHHPNETVEVDGLLYGALEKAVRSGGRYIYLAPVYTQYHTLFNCGDISETVNYDPYVNPEIAAYFGKICGYITDESAIGIQLLGSGKVRLNVSDDYLAYCKAEQIDTFVDFYWMRNAFIIDYFAESLQEAGFIHGYISSYDGLVRNLDEGGQEFTLNICAQVDRVTYAAAALTYPGGRNFVYLRDFQIDAAHDRCYFNMGDGEFRTAYIDPADGLCKSSADSLILYSDTEGCADMLLSALPVYISDGAMEGPAGDTAAFSLWTAGDSILYNDPGISFSEVRSYEEKGVRFKTVFTG